VKAQRGGGLGDTRVTLIKPVNPGGHHNQMSHENKEMAPHLHAVGVALDVPPPMQCLIDHAIEDEIVHKAMNLEDSAGLKEIKTVAALTVFGREHKFKVDRPTRLCAESRLN
jgi:hypothetical protein